ncbi:RNA polymerase sigma factor [Pseudodesulfovibrio piezophilus]|uniref:RNA polymerase, sigma-24 subunit, ECF subfamily (Modular protein) n=1 Tax=Pseudodesulfovibrio piezophilus (strain DSM 21447 / JCM 15486 / C1TLV30) TaxID=1322246 RepID=M1WX43_PSEP2|nr:sigma-70 family RNA polymerase sigma factor [Pseudodesulfovibrio piezophilus]CCH49503.1 RNA polymerase, sigma-24 subunit, ECF subfamily (modular protein) [Pseudodesulfovibrio piezophilus C1TLV30]
MSNTLIESQRTSDGITYDVLFKEHSKLIFKLINNFIKVKNIRLNNTEVDDIYQDIALKIFKNDYLSKYDREKSSFITWLNIICRTTVIDFYRKKMRFMDEILGDAGALETEGSVDATLFSLPADVLTERQAEVITLFFKDGMVTSEIASALNITSRTVRSIKFQALARLREHYGAASTSPDQQKPETAQDTTETRRKVS